MTAMLHVLFFCGGLLLAPSRRDGCGQHWAKVRHHLDRPATSQPTIVRLADLGRDAWWMLRLPHHLVLSLSPSVPCILIAD